MCYIGTDEDTQEVADNEDDSSPDCIWRCKLPGNEVGDTEADEGSRSNPSPDPCIMLMGFEDSSFHIIAWATGPAHPELKCYTYLHFSTPDTCQYSVYFLPCDAWFLTRITDYPITSSVTIIITESIFPPIA